MFIYKVDEELIGPGVNPVIIREEMSRAQEANERGRPKRVRIVTSFKYNTRVRKTDLSDPNFSLALGERHRPFQKGNICGRFGGRGGGRGGEGGGWR